MSPSTWRWIMACALAETIGMTASAGAARAADGIALTSFALAIVVAGGLVEGAALGAAQGSVLAQRLPKLSRARWFWMTLVVAGIGWAAASAPAVLSADEPAGTPPPLWLVLLGAAGIGLAMGPVLGGAQALALRGVAASPARWVLANTIAWPPVMVVIFVGATRPEASWSVPAVLAVGAVTGACAGALLGWLTSHWLPDPVGADPVPRVPEGQGSEAIWSLVRDERLALADLLEGLTPEQWAAQSLCSAWTVKDVAAHVAPTVGGGLGQFAVALVRAGFNPNRASERVVQASAAVPMSAIVADLRANADQRAAPPGLGVGSQLADVLVHTLDIAVPLGIAVERPAEHWRQTLAWLVGPQARRGFVPPGRPEVGLVADDVGWVDPVRADGGGPTAHGPARALALALCGRDPLLDQVTGPGAAALADWVAASRRTTSPMSGSRE